MAKIEGAKRADAFTIDPDKVVIPESGPLYDPRNDLPVEESMVLNIMFHGVLEPILVRKNGLKVEVVAGRQRVKATREANRRLKERGEMPLKVPCILKTGTDAQLYGMLISENECRRNDDPVTLGKKAQRLVDMGASVPDIATICTVSTETVRRWLALNDLAPELKEAVQGGEISAEAARELGDLAHAEQAAALENAKKEGGPITIKRARKAAADLGGQPPKGGKSLMRCRREIRSKIDAFCGKPINETTLQERHWAEALEWVLYELDELELSQATPPRAAAAPPRPNGRAAEAHI